MDLSIWQALPDSCDADDFRESMAPNVQSVSHSEFPAASTTSAGMQLQGPKHPAAAAVPQTSLATEHDAETTHARYKVGTCQV
jgi:hypothetical protein